MFLFNKKFIITLLLLLASGLAGVPTVHAQSKADSTHKGVPVVRRLRFVGNRHFGTSLLETIVRTHTNREFLGIPMVTPWYWLWELTHFVGEKPAALDRNMVGQDISRLKLYYESQGFFYTTVDTTVIEYRKNRYEVSFIVNEGEPSFVKRIYYSGMPAFPDTTLRDRFYKQSDLTEKKINDTTYTANQRFTFDGLSNERERLISYLKNHGYAAVQRDSVTVQIKKEPQDTLKLALLFLVQHGPVYHFGNTYIDLAGPDNDTTYDRQDTLKSPPFTAANTNKMLILKMSTGAHSRFSLLTDQLLFKPGELFNNQQYVQTINEFQNLGMMNVRRFALNKTGGLPDYSQKNLPVLIDLQSLPRRSISMDLFGMQRYGYGAGAGLTYTDNNVFGKAQQLQIGTKGSFEYVSQKSLTKKILYSLEGSISYIEPKLNFPFNFLDKAPLFLNSRTRYQLSVTHVNQDNFNINANIRLDQRYEVDHDQYTRSTLDLPEIDWTDASATGQFLASLDSTFKNNEIQKKFILEDFKPQVNSTIRYTFRRAHTDIIERNYGYYFEAGIESGGNIPYLIDRFVTTPGKVEGSIPTFGISNSRLTYSQYAKVSFDYRRYIPVSPNAVFAYAGFLGYAIPFGKSKTIPLTKRFYAGGSNDIRGWAPFRLGPGPLEDQQLINGGEIKLAGHVEIRQEIFKRFLSTKWVLAMFTDFGNVWNGPRNPITTGRFAFNSFYKQIAVGSGFGIRLDWQYVIFRIDFAYRVHDLKKGWFKKNALGLSFGIGQSF